MFKIHKEATSWAENLLDKDSPFKIQFDIYYICFIVGIGKGKSPSFQASEVSDMIGHYPEVYAKYRDLLGGVLLVAELSSAKLPMDRNLIKSKLTKLLSYQSPSALSDEAIELMNQYAFGGFEIMRENLPKTPVYYEFLTWFTDEILPDCFEQEDWVF